MSYITYLHSCYTAVGNYAERLKINLVNKNKYVHDADFTARKLLTNSWDTYVVNNLSFKISDKSFFVDTNFFNFVY